uniref:WGS project CBMI000000000 data, contig CS3069_c001257 n=1 Tax=Fusarium clavum TaxID=2594811 RepID=A0A090MFP3_9HYPO|nr:unnamed protein product [Fusarium clavum]CEG05763.1 unnamed protein product [Fusarium clavum]
MGAVYPVYQRDPLSDDMQAYNTYAPASDVSFISQNPSGTKIYYALPQRPWEQWWSRTKGASVAESTNITASNVFAQEEPRRRYSHDPEISTRWDSPTSAHSYPVPSPATTPTSLDIPVGDTENRSNSSSAESDKLKRKRSTTKLTASKPMRRASTKAIKQETAPQKSKGCGSQAKPVSKPTEQSCLQSDDELDQYSKRIQESNRVASNKFRIKKREEAKKLQTNEENIMQTNRKLSSSVLDLTQQIYELKMKLLQHTDCDCHLIQEYIANKANQYIHDLGRDKKPQTTAPRPP